MAQSITLPELVSNAVTNKSKIGHPKDVVLKETFKDTPSKHPFMNTRVEKRGLTIKRRYTQRGVDAYSMIDFETRDSRITEPDGTVVFEMKNVEVPKTWSQLATDIIAQKYFRKRGVGSMESGVNSSGVNPTGKSSKEERNGEHSAKQTVHRVAHTLRTFGEKQGYFASKENADAFEQELKFLCITQRGAFNSPVWFNCGLWHEYGIVGDKDNYAWDFKEAKVVAVENAYERPQCSACFIQKVDDSLMGIFELAKNEAKLFKYGSGTGSNFSSIRSKYENLSGGGISSGLMSFLEVLDRGAGAIKSGGTTRRAAKMVVLDVDHPEIREFVNWKVESERKAKALMDAGYEGDWRGEAYRTVSGQNSNNSVRVMNAFMETVEKKEKFWTRLRTGGQKHEEIPAEELFNEICKAAWSCADPGLQFDTTINDWHTCPGSGRINASNPCSEYMFLDDTACNLASLNLLKYLDENGHFDVEAYRHAVEIFFTAQEILVDLSSYPTESIAQNSHDFRPLGLGYANLGTLLMMMGIAYDSDEGRAIAAALTAILHCHAYVVSAEMAAAVGPFVAYEKNKKSMLHVMRKHQAAAHTINVKSCPDYLYKAACEDADRMVQEGEKNGYRNAQATVLAPTGTIGLLMDCDTTGVEPEFSIVKWKKLAGGGYFKIINKSIPLVLERLGYTQSQIEEMVDYVLGKGKKEGVQTLEGAPHLKEEHLVIFDCANKCGKGKRYIAPLGHVKMMAAVQPFISGAISKTVNLPHEATVEDIKDIYLESWKSGLKAIALYRDGSKHSQPLSNKESRAPSLPEGTVLRGSKISMPTKRSGITVEASIAGQKMYLRTGEYDDGKLGEIFVDTFKEGASYRSLLNCFAIAISIGLQYGVPLEKYVDSFTFTRFEPSGFTTHPNIRTCTSVVDFIFRVLGMEYLGRTDFVHVEPKSTQLQENTVKGKITEAIMKEAGASAASTEASSLSTSVVSRENALTATNALDQQLQGMMGDAPLCSTCGHVTVRNATCYKCLNCGNSMGCS